MFASHLVMTMAMVLAPPSAPNESRPTDAEATDIEISSIEDQSVPSSDAGVLVKMKVREGDRVTKDMELARVDDREAQAQLTVKSKDYAVAKQEADSDVNIRFNEVTAGVAKQAHKRLLEANKGAKGTVSEIEVLRAELEFKKAELGIEKAEQEHTSNALTADAKKAEVDAANVGVSRRILRAPFDGVVIRVFRHEGEWVSPGDPVVQIVRVDRLRINGNVAAAEWGPADIDGRRVTVAVTLPRGRVEKVPGRVVFVSPVVALDNLPVWAEIDTPMVGGKPLVHAGLKATMTIHVNQPAEPEARPLPAAAKTPPAKTPPVKTPSVTTSGKPDSSPPVKATPVKSTR
jgi:multidrug efflux pump subunit AcrA (membrane-fusion protein)